MIHLHFKKALILLPLFFHLNAEGQSIINDWNDTNHIISSVSDTTGKNRNIILDWSTTLGNFGENIKISKEKIQKDISNKDSIYNHSKHFHLKNMEFNLPSYINKEGIDLYLLTEEGMNIYLAMTPPAFYQNIDDDVEKWILYYGYEKRDYTKIIFSRYHKLKPMIDKLFKRNGIPIELGLLTIVESACQPDAISNAGAVGMWQFMADTGTDFGLNTSIGNDERFLPEKSTIAASKYFKKAYKITRNWTLAAAAYNCGIGRTKGLLYHSKHKDWDHLKPYFPPETRQYIPALIAVYYVWTYKKELGF